MPSPQLPRTRDSRVVPKGRLRSVPRRDDFGFHQRFEFGLFSQWQRSILVPGLPPTSHQFLQPALLGCGKELIRSKSLNDQECVFPNFRES